MSRNSGSSRGGGSRGGSSGGRNQSTGGRTGNTRASTGRGNTTTSSNRRTTGNNQAGFGSVISRVAAAIAGALASGKKKKTGRNTRPTNRPASPLDSGRYTQKQLDRKFKHAKDFGVTDTRKNPQTLTRYRDAIDRHLADKDTVKKGTYAYKPDSVVHYNKNTNNVVVTEKNGTFISGWKLDKNSPQFKHYMERGVLR